MSSSPKYSLRRSLYVYLDSNRSGSYNTRASRKRIINQVLTELVDGGYRLRHVEGLKRKHIKYLNDKWLAAGLGVGTIKNRNSHLRWLCRAMNKPGVMMSNKELGVPSRIYIDNVDRSLALEKVDFSKVEDERIKVALHLQYYFGLRREEVSKMQPYWADQGDHIRLKAAWCKGKRARKVPVHNKEARYWLDQAKMLAGKKGCSLIPINQNYKQFIGTYKYEMKKAGIKCPHGLRHKFAQLL